MKYLLFISFIFLFSCESQPERCKLCTTTVYVNGDTKGEIIKKEIYCNEELKYMDGLTVRVTEEDNAGFVSISITRCK